MRDYIEHLKAKPEHTRRQVALGTAASVAGFVFLGWATVLVSSGTLALESDTTDRPLAEAGSNANTEIAGAAAALSSALSGKATVTAVEPETSSTLDQTDTGEATVIPF